MPAHHASAHLAPSDFCEDHIWDELYSKLRPHVLTWIRSYNLSTWLGQEQEIAEDILQETFIRVFKYIKQIETASNRPIKSLESFSMTVAHNCIRDMRRKQYRLVRFTTLSEIPNNNKADIYASTDPLELALVHLISRDTLMELARIIIDFPPGQRRAILIDLAHHSDFDEESGPLHIIFLELGVNLREYRLIHLLNSVERSRHASLLTIAYKRLKQTFCMKARMPVV